MLDPIIFNGAQKVMPVWGIRRVDPGYIYIIESHGRYKIGKTKNSVHRLRTAKTWLPDMNLVALKPFWGVSCHERWLHCGFASYWYTGEWFNFDDDDDARDLLIEGFTEFSDTNPDVNSRDFIYWFNSEGLSEFIMEQDHLRVSLPKFQKQESWVQKNRNPGRGT